jgi:hypothetical protein
MTGACPPPAMPRRVRARARIVKCAISKCNTRSPNIDCTTYKATVAIAMLAAAT